MNNELRNTLLTLSEWKKELDEVIPIVANTAKQIIDSPEVQAVVEIGNKARDVLPKTIQRFEELLSPYAEIVRDYTENVYPLLIEIARISIPLSVISRLGNIQYVAWKSFPDSFYEQASETNSEQELLGLVEIWLENDRFKEVEKTIQSLFETEPLKNNLVFSQAVSAYRRDDYDLACLGLTAMIDRLLSDLSGMITSTSISKRVEKIKDKVIKSKKVALDEIELSNYILIGTYTYAIEAFCLDSRFDKNEPELINRHWIAHGRMNRSMERIDCIRMINLLYGTILMSELGKK